MQPVDPSIVATHVVVASQDNGRLVMDLQAALAGIDQVLARDAFDGAFEKCANFDEAGVMIDILADGYPALAGVVARLGDRITEEVADERGRTCVVLGGVLALLALVEYATAAEMRRRFPDATSA